MQRARKRVPCAKSVSCAREAFSFATSSFTSNRTNFAIRGNEIGRVRNKANGEDDERSFAISGWNRCTHSLSRWKLRNNYLCSFFLRPSTKRSISSRNSKCESNQECHENYIQFLQCTGVNDGRRSDKKVGVKRWAFEANVNSFRDAESLVLAELWGILFNRNSLTNVELSCLNFLLYGRCLFRDDLPLRYIVHQVSSITSRDSLKISNCIAQVWTTKDTNSKSPERRAASYRCFPHDGWNMAAETCFLWFEDNIEI